MPFSHLSIRNAEYVVDAASGQNVFHVYDPHALAQAAGYLKYRNGKTNEEAVFFRGETKLHGSLSPTLFRRVTKQASQANRTHALKDTIEAFKKKNNIFASFPEQAHEPILQHYGLRTSWVDVVDNVWIALWFACHKARATGQVGEHLHFERRSPHIEPQGYAYILLIAADNGGNTYIVPGIHRSSKTELIDLRVAAPSIFLRPHSQHGLLFRVRGDSVRRPVDYSSQIRGIIRISLTDALFWLGDGKMLGIHALFPPPYYDHGYAILLGSGIQGSDVVGTIAHVGA